MLKAENLTLFIFIDGYFKRDSFKLPTIQLSNVDILNGEFDYEIKDYEYHPTIKAPLSN
mgnify:CR=1 FL=1